MDELIKAIINLINTSSALADDALYLFVVLELVKVLGTAAPFMTVAYLGYKAIIKAIETTSIPAKSPRLRRHGKENNGQEIDEEMHPAEVGTGGKQRSAQRVAAHG